MLIIIAHNIIPDFILQSAITTSYNCFKLLKSFRMQSANPQRAENEDPYSHPRYEEVDVTPAEYDMIAVSAPTYENTRRQP